MEADKERASEEEAGDEDVGHQRDDVLLKKGVVEQDHQPLFPIQVPPNFLNLVVDNLDGVYLFKFEEEPKEGENKGINHDQVI